MFGVSPKISAAASTITGPESIATLAASAGLLVPSFLRLNSARARWIAPMRQAELPVCAVGGSGQRSRNRRTIGPQPDVFRATRYEFSVANNHCISEKLGNERAQSGTSWLHQS